MSADRAYPGLLIAFEGPEIGERPRAVEAVRNRLEAQGRQVLVSRWMGSALSGEVYRKAAVLYELSPRTLAMLAACDLAERMEWEILPALRSGMIVLADRYLYRVALGLARDVDPDWLEVLCGAGPVPDAVLHFPVAPRDVLLDNQTAQLDLYEAGMDLGMTHDLPLSYRLYQERLVEAYEEWAEQHGIALNDLPSADAAVQQVEALLGLAAERADRRRLAVADLLRTSGADPNHARQVARLARRLFELTADVHRLGRREQDLLEYACLVHDIGSEGTGEERPYRSARQLREAELDGFSDDERTAMAVLIAIHRATDSAAEVDDWLRSLPDDLQRSVALLGPLLRLADGLDATRRQSIRWLDATIHDGLFDIVLRSKEKGKQEIKMAVERAELFEQAYGLHLAIDVKRKGAPPAGAESFEIAVH